MKHTIACMLAAAAILAACGSSAKAPPTAAATKEKSAATKASSFAKKSPPTGATSMGMQSMPTMGKLTIPITNVEVYVFTSDIDGGSADTLYWAATSDAAYVWGQIALDCVDDAGASTGETGTADFVYEATDSGYGWMLSTDACGYSTDFGCSGTSAADEVCGGCDWNSEFVACVAS